MSIISSQENDIDKIEHLFLRCEFKKCKNDCIEYLQSHMKLMDATSKEISLEMYQQNNVQTKYLIAVILLQCLVENEDANAEKDLLFLERFLRQNGPIPFDLILGWIKLKIHLNDYDAAKGLLESSFEALANRIDNKKDIASPALSEQYTVLSYVYVVQLLPRMGELDTAQKFLARHTHGTLLTRTLQQDLLYALENEIELSRLSKSGELSPERASHEHNSSSQATAKNDVMNPEPQQNRPTEPMSRKRDGDEPALILTRKQVVIGSVAAIVVVSALTERRRLSRAFSTFAQFMGNLMFSGT